MEISGEFHALPPAVGAKAPSTDCKSVDGPLAGLDAMEEKKKYISPAGIVRPSCQ
jgi:hypothetical protein